VLLYIYGPKHIPSPQGEYPTKSFPFLFVRPTLPQLLLEETEKDALESFSIFLNLIQNYLTKICVSFAALGAFAVKSLEKGKSEEASE
jgi:hypothetical protein